MEILNNNTIELEDADKFTIVKADIRQAKTVNGMKFKAIDKMIYCYLLGYKRSAENPESRVTNVRPQFRKIQAEHGVSKGTVESTMKTLEQMGLIIVTRKTGGHNIYDVVEFDQVVATHLEIKKDDFILEREANKEERAQPKKASEPKAEPPKRIVQAPPQQQTFDHDDFLGSCGISDDQQFAKYQGTKRSAPKLLTKYDDGRCCSQCYRDNSGGWDCTNHMCDNYIPF